MLFNVILVGDVVFYRFNVAYDITFRRHRMLRAGRVVVSTVGMRQRPICNRNRLDIRAVVT